MYFDINASVFENLRGGKNSDRYEFILPNIIYGKTFFTEKLKLKRCNKPLKKSKLSLLVSFGYY